jgi:Zn finger protein HypA/HybF involved in hydrogenase expression
MVQLDIAGALTAFLFSSLAVMLGVWLYYSARRRAWLPAPTKKVIYRCGKCQHFYVEAGGKKPCPQCGRENEELQF